MHSASRQGSEIHRKLRRRHKDFKAARKENEEAEKRVIKHDRWLSGIAAAAVMRNIPETLQGTEEGVIPRWASKAHPTHKTLKHAGGVVMCAACNSISSSGGGNSHLWKPCAAKIAQGSLPRYRRFLAGWHPHFAADHGKSWPNGAATTAPQKVYTVKRDAEGNFTDSQNLKAAATVSPLASTRSTWPRLPVPTLLQRTN